MFRFNQLAEAVHEPRTFVVTEARFNAMKRDTKGHIRLREKTMLWQGKIQIYSTSFYQLVKCLLGFQNQHGYRSTACGQNEKLQEKSVRKLLEHEFRKAKMTFILCNFPKNPTIFQNFCRSEKVFILFVLKYIHSQ